MADPKIRYTGDGSFHQDIPARTLTAEEYEALPTELRAIVRDSPLYDYAGYKGKAQAAKVADKPADSPKTDAPKQDAPKQDAPAPKADTAAQTS